MILERFVNLDGKLTERNGVAVVQLDPGDDDPVPVGAVAAAEVPDRTPIGRDLENGMASRDADVVHQQVAFWRPAHEGRTLAQRVAQRGAVLRVAERKHRYSETWVGRRKVC